MHYLGTNRKHLRCCPINRSLVQTQRSTAYIRRRCSRAARRTHTFTDHLQHNTGIKRRQSEVAVACDSSMQQPSQNIVLFHCYYGSPRLKTSLLPNQQKWRSFLCYSYGFNEDIYDILQTERAKEYSSIPQEISLGDSVTGYEVTHAINERTVLDTFTPER